MEIFTNILTKLADKPATTTMSGISESAVEPPAVYGGDPNALNPEEMFVASINSCIMLVFYHFVKKYEVAILSYTSTANGKVEKTKDGLRFTSVEVQAEVSLGDDGSAEKIEEMAKLAEQYCLVSNSVSCPVSYSIKVS